MNTRLHGINHSLRLLDAAHRSGRISREDYRARRRHLLGTLCDGGGITARHDVATTMASHAQDRTVPTPRHAGDEAVSALFPRRSWLFFWRRWLSRHR